MQKDSEEVLAKMTQQMKRDADPTRHRPSVGLPLMHPLHAARAVDEQPPEEPPTQWLMQRHDINRILERKKISNQALSREAYVRLEQGE